ncbi:Membrane-bound transcription factor site-1 protease, partial [Fasciolopsis buskii]
AALQQNAAVTTAGIHSDQQPAHVPINPASIKQALIASATRLSHVRVFGTKFPRWPDEEGVDTSSMFEQGAGLLDLVKSLLIMQRIKPQASLLPSYLDLTECPYMWPYCSQPIYYGMQPIVINVTILNSMDIVGWIKQPIVYRPFTKRNGHRLRVRFTHSERLWPWVGYLAVHLDVESNVNEPVPSSRFSGIAEGVITFTVESAHPPTVGTRTTNLTLPIRANIVPTPDRSRRILFDQFHSLRYPSGYIPRDDLTRKSEPLDWLGDHMHTNLRDLYIHLRKANYFVEILTAPYTCFDAYQYGALLVIDPEEEFFPEEVEKVVADVTQKGLSLIVFAEWYNTSLIQALQFYDTNTK